MFKIYFLVLQSFVSSDQIDPDFSPNLRTFHFAVFLKVSFDDKKGRTFQQKHGKLLSNWAANLSSCSVCVSVSSINVVPVTLLLRTSHSVAGHVSFCR